MIGRENNGGFVRWSSCTSSQESWSWEFDNEKKKKKERMISSWDIEGCFFSNYAGNWKIIDLH